MWSIQSQLRPSEGFWRVYPELVYGQWRWRLNRPSIYIGAGDWSPHYLGMRFVRHILGWFWKGFGFIQSPRVLAAGIVLTTSAVIAYIRHGYDAVDRRFWKFHATWLFVHIAITLRVVPPSGTRRNSKYWTICPSPRRMKKCCVMRRRFILRIHP